MHTNGKSKRRIVLVFLPVFIILALAVSFLPGDYAVKADENILNTVLQPSKQLDGASRFLCAYDPTSHTVWCALRVKQSADIPIISPSRQTWVYRLDLETESVSLEFKTWEFIWEMTADPSGFFYTKDKAFFLDHVICHYDRNTGKNTVIRPALKTIGRMIAMYNYNIIYQGSTTYEDDRVYLYNMMNGETSVISDAVTAACVNGSSLYIVSETNPDQILEFNLASGSSALSGKAECGMYVSENNDVIVPAGELPDAVRTDLLSGDIEPDGIILNHDRVYVFRGDSLSAYSKATGRQLQSMEVDLSASCASLCGNCLVTLDTGTFAVSVRDMDTSTEKRFQLPY